MEQALNRYSHMQEPGTELPVGVMLRLYTEMLADLAKENHANVLVGIGENQLEVGKILDRLQKASRAETEIRQALKTIADRDGKEQEMERVLQEAFAFVPRIKLREGGKDLRRVLIDYYIHEAQESARPKVGTYGQVQRVDFEHAGLGTLSAMFSGNNILLTAMIGFGWIVSLSSGVALINLWPIAEPPRAMQSAAVDLDNLFRDCASAAGEIATLVRQGNPQGFEVAEFLMSDKSRCGNVLKPEDFKF